MIELYGEPHTGRTYAPIIAAEWQETDWVPLIFSKDRHGWGCRAKNTSSLVNCTCILREEFVDTASKAFHNPFRIFS